MKLLLTCSRLIAATAYDQKEVAMKTNLTRYSKPVVGIVLLLACSLALQAATPAGWFVAGSRPASYEAGSDAQAASNEHASVYLKSKEPVSDGFGTLMQEFRADKYAGKRVRLSAFVKSEDVQDWAGLWMRVDKDKDSIAFDNMQGPADQRHNRLAELCSSAGCAAGCNRHLLWRFAGRVGERLAQQRQVRDCRTRGSNNWARYARGRTEARSVKPALKQLDPCPDLRTDCPATAL